MFKKNDYFVLNGNVPTWNLFIGFTKDVREKGISVLLKSDRQNDFYYNLTHEEEIQTNSVKNIVPVDVFLKENLNKFDLLTLRMKIGVNLLNERSHLLSEKDAKKLTAFVNSKCLEKLSDNLSQQI